MQWNDERIALLKELAARGLSAGQIAVQMARLTGQTITRNSVIGKLHRANVKLLGTAGRQGRNPPPLKAAEDRVERIASVPPPPPRPRAKLPRYVMPPSPSSGVDSVMGLRVADCRWPVGDPRSAEFRFCCAKRVREHRQPYCAHHIRQAAKQ